MKRADRRNQVRAAAPQVTHDGYQNVVASVGIGVDRIASAGTHRPDFISRNRQLLEFIYRTSWIIGRAVDAVAEDMVRAGIDINLEEHDPKCITDIRKGFERRLIWQSLASTVKWSRLYGGAVAVLLIEGQDFSTPLRLETVGPKAPFKGLFVFDRWSVNPSLNDPVTELGPYLGQPKFYDVLPGAKALAGTRIHHSRIIRLDGFELPYWQSYSENGWGMSIVERIHDRLLAFDSTTQGTAQLVFKAYLRTIKVKDLRRILSTGGPAETSLLKMFRQIKELQTNEGLTVIDAEDDLQYSTYGFSGLDSVMAQMAQQLSGAVEIPLVRLFGQTPTGLNNNGEADIRSYYDLNRQQQEAKLRIGVEKILDLVALTDVPGYQVGRASFEFNSLWQMTDSEKATVASGVTGAVLQAAESGLVKKETALRELRQSAEITGIWSNISDDEINDAELEMPPGPEMDGYSQGDPSDGIMPEDDGIVDDNVPENPGSTPVLQ